MRLVCTPVSILVVKATFQDKRAARAFFEEVQNLPDVVKPRLARSNLVEFYSFDGRAAQGLAHDFEQRWIASHMAKIKIEEAPVLTIDVAVEAPVETPVEESVDEDAESMARHLKARRESREKAARSLSEEESSGSAGDEN